MGSVDQKIFFTFPNQLVHRRVAGSLMPMLHSEFESTKVFSAGTITFRENGKIECSGGSESLGVLSHPDDAEVISIHDYLHGLISSDEEITVEDEKELSKVLNS